MEDYYEILGCSHTASAEEIAQAYRKSALKFHPDKVPHEASKNPAESLRIATERFILLTDAYETLRNPNRRHAYNLRMKMYGSSSFAAMEEKEMEEQQEPWTLYTLYSYLTNTPLWKWGWLWLRNFDPVLSDVVQRWVDDINRIYTNESSYNPLTKSECVQWCANIIKNYLERKFSMPEYHNIYKLQMSDELIDQPHINVECSLDFIRKYSAVDILYEAKHKHTLARFDLRNEECCLRYLDRKITFVFQDNFPENTARFGIYDIQMKVSIPANMVGQIILLTHEYEKDNKLVCNLHIDGRSHIYRIVGHGIYDATYKKWGDCYVSIQIEDGDTTGYRGKGIYSYDVVTKEIIPEGQTVYSSLSLEELQEIFSK
jgi:hypothetical protein